MFTTSDIHYSTDISYTTYFVSIILNTNCTFISLKQQAGKIMTHDIQLTDITYSQETFPGGRLLSSVLRPCQHSIGYMRDGGKAWERRSQSYSTVGTAFKPALCECTKAPCLHQNSSTLESESKFFLHARPVPPVTNPGAPLFGSHRK